MVDASELWALGNYPRVAEQLEPAARELLLLAGVRGGDRILDVAAGTGNLALAAAARGARVSACDLTPRMVDLGRERTDAAGVHVEWRRADACALPWPDGAFDRALSVFGVMYASPPERAAAELARVVRAGGRVGVASWGPRGLTAAMHDVARESGARPAEPSPLEWGDPEVAVRRLGAVVQEVALHPRRLEWAFRDPLDAVEWFLRYSAPWVALAQVLSEDERAGLGRRLADALEERARPFRDGILLDAEYLIAIGTR